MGEGLLAYAFGVAKFLNAQPDEFLQLILHAKGFLVLVGSWQRTMRNNARLEQSPPFGRIICPFNQKTSQL